MCPRASGKSYFPEIVEKTPPQKNSFFRFLLAALRLRAPPTHAAVGGHRFPKNNTSRSARHIIDFFADAPPRRPKAPSRPPAAPVIPSGAKESISSRYRRVGRCHGSSWGREGWAEWKFRKSGTSSSLISLLSNDLRGSGHAHWFPPRCFVMPAPLLRHAHGFLPRCFVMLALLHCYACPAASSCLPCLGICR